MKNIVLALLVGGLWIQAVPPLRLGPTSDRLTAEDLDQIGAITQQKGGRSWLILGRSLSGPGGGSIPWEVWTFLEPAGPTGPVRRGVLLRLVARLPRVDAYAAPKSWTIRATRQWAQIVTPGQAPDKLEDSRDRNRPFAIEGELSDSILQEVVGVIRSSPVLGDPAPVGVNQAPSPLLCQVQGAWPILSIRLQDGGRVEVTLVRDDDELSGQTVVVQKTGRRWVLASVNFWIW